MFCFFRQRPTHFIGRNPQIQLQWSFSLGLVGFSRESSNSVQGGAGGVGGGAEVEGGRWYKPLLAFLNQMEESWRFQLFKVDNELISQFSAVPSVSVFRVIWYNYFRFSLITPHTHLLSTTFLKYLMFLWLQAQKASSPRLPLSAGLGLHSPCPAGSVTLS